MRAEGPNSKDVLPGSEPNGIEICCPQKSKHKWRPVAPMLASKLCRDAGFLAISPWTSGRKCAAWTGASPTSVERLEGQRAAPPELRTALPASYSEVLLLWKTMSICTDDPKVRPSH